MDDTKRCMLIYPSGKREYIYKSNKANYHNNYVSDLVRFIDNINANNEDRGVRGSYCSNTGASTNRFTLVYEGTSYTYNSINIVNIENENNHCCCGNTIVHDWHGVMGISKYINGEQADYEDGDLERAIAHEQKGLSSSLYWSIPIVFMLGCLIIYLSK